MDAKDQIKNLLEKAGITINGPNDFDIKVLDERIYRKVLSGGSMALGESYMDGWWEVKALDKFFYKIFLANLHKSPTLFLSVVPYFLKSFIFNLQNPSRAFLIGNYHYDIGNDFYQAMLGKTLAYSCGYWKNASWRSKNLDEAQMAKFNLICQKIGLKSGDYILDVGCGWGTFLKFAAQNYGAKGLGITVSKNQVELAQELCNGMPIEIKLQDYRNIEGKFDHIVSVGMFEHVGVKNYRVYMSKMRALLKDNGLFLLHTIGSNKSILSNDPWITKYIFPNSMLPSVTQITQSIEGLFAMEDWHSFGSYYDKTLMAWFGNLNEHWPQLNLRYPDKFYRMWKYYLLSCAGNFRACHSHLWQVVFSKQGVPGGYKSIR